MQRFYFGPSRIIRQLLCLAGLATLLAGLTPGWGQQPAGKADKSGKPVREEEEEPGRTKPKITLRVDDDTTIIRPGSGAIDLKKEAEQARHPAVRELFKAIATPHDRVTYAAQGRVELVAPLPFFVDLKQVGEGSLDLEPLEGKPHNESRKRIAKVDHYEAFVINQVDDFFQRGAKDILRLEMLQQAEKALGEAVRFHESARQRGIRKGKIGWDELEKQLRGRLLDVRIEQLDALVKEKKSTAAQDLLEQLTEIYPGHPRFLSALLRIRVQQIEDGLIDEQVDRFIQASRALGELQRQFPQAELEEPVKRLRARLQKKAESLLKAAEGLPDPKRQDQLRLVENIWPEMPGLQKILEKSKGYRILNVGVRHLPENLSPATAFVDAEKLALDLLFESLVRVVPDAVVGQRYEPLLAAGSPEHMMLGRQFELVRDAYWYREANGKLIKEPVLASDVSRTVLAQQKWPARSAEWRDLLGGAQLEGDQHTIRLTLQQGYVDPLALMTFRILPARLVQQPDDREFARQPVGSGPYQYVGQVQGRDRPFARFLVNPTYGKRAGRTTPAIDEIRFYPIREDVRTDLVTLPLHLLYDLPAKQIEEVKSKEAGIQNVSIVNLKNRRVWFLAVNQRRRDLQNDDLRRAIGLAIDRERILDDAFRPKVVVAADGFRTKESLNQPDRSMHRVLTGPYPPGTWACKESNLLNLYRPDDARARAKTAVVPTRPLTLKYPSDLHPGIPGACQLIQQQVKKETGIELVLQGMPWRQLQHAVEREHDYELAYYCWDHADDRYWLGPLFDPAGAVPDGRNFLGCDDPELTDLFRRARDRRQFSQLQQLTHLIHQQINQKLPLIPLWQLDTCMVLRNDVTTLPAADQLDPLRLFGQVEAWKLK